MKNSEQIAAAVLAARDNALQKKQRRIRRLTGVTAAASVICILGGVLYAAGRFYAAKENIPAVMHEDAVPAASDPQDSTAGTEKRVQTGTAKTETAEGEQTAQTAAEYRTEPAPADSAAEQPVTALQTDTAAALTAASDTAAATAVHRTETTAATAAPVQTKPATTAAAALPETCPGTEPPSNPGTPGAVFTSLAVSYDEAKEAFAHPIVRCERDDFLQYKIGIVSPDGNIHSERAFCLSLEYVFANGAVHLSDQDRLSGSSASDFGTAYTYSGRTFYVREEWGSRMIGYYPDWDIGIAYEAVFDLGTDIYEIMNLMISVEIE